MNYRPLAAYASLVFAAVAFDQWMKRLVEAGLVLEKMVDVVHHSHAALSQRDIDCHIVFRGCSCHDAWSRRSESVSTPPF